jgi:hypothetical protein
MRRGFAVLSTAMTLASVSFGVLGCSGSTGISGPQGQVTVGGHTGAISASCRHSGSKEPLLTIEGSDPNTGTTATVNIYDKAVPLALQGMFLAVHDGDQDYAVDETSDLTPAEYATLSQATIAVHGTEWIVSGQGPKERPGGGTDGELISYEVKANCP